MILAYEVQPTEGKVADPLVEKSHALVPHSPWRLWVSDGWDPYGAALVARHSLWQHFPSTGKRGRPKVPRRIPHPWLQYAQVVKIRNRFHHVIGIKRRVVFGHVHKRDITTWCIERQNLTFRHEIRCLTRKTIAFAKSLHGLDDRLAFYQPYFNFMRLHGGLRIRISTARGPHRWRRRTPAMAAGLADHRWTLEEFLAYKSSVN
jgi:hypothetical protein